MMLIPPVMIDLETGGLGPDAPIGAIGAVRFNHDGSPVEGDDNEFYIAVNLEGQPPPDASTMYWWMKQSDEARAAFCEGEHGVGLLSALWKLRHWMARATPHHVVMQLGVVHTGEVWVRGDRDSVWLDQAHRRNNLPLPFKYSQVRDQRTIVKFAEERGVDMPRPEGVAHNALADAKHQVECLQVVMKVYPSLGDF